jgi:mannose-6-phosphate isomerase
MPLEKLTARLFPKVWGCEVWFEGAAPLPVLIKFIITFDKLSVQVHPDDNYARKHHKSVGKTEMWHILSAQPGARIAAGFREPLSRPQLRKAALSGDIEQLLEWHPVEPGDTFFIPAGTVHAIGGGMVLCEIQQYSDITYRLYDYGRPRELHLDHAVAVSKREPHQGRSKSANGELVCCPYFTTVRRRIKGRARLAPEVRFIVVTHGKGKIAGKSVHEGEVWHAEPGSSQFPIEGKDLTILAVTAASKSQPDTPDQRSRLQKVRTPKRR